MKMNITDLETPCFLVDINKVRKNAKNMMKICDDLGVSLRPHTKTHKTIEVAEIQTDGKKSGLTVSTLQEAEAYADAGFDDILLAHPVTQDKLKRCVALTKRLEKFIVMISDVDGLKCLQRNQNLFPEGKRWSVVIEIDTGYKRTGFPWNSKEIIDVAKGVVESMNLIAVYCHCGSAYDITTAKERTEHHKSVTKCLLDVRFRIQQALPQAPHFIIGTGSTPACSLYSKCHTDLDEFHPGNYVFYDVEQYLLNACRQSDIAGKVMTRVISHKPDENMILVDCGWTALTVQGMDIHPDNYCIFEGENNLKLVGMSQEIGKVKAKHGELDCRLYPVGTILFILPFHACATACMHQVYHVHDGDELVDTWKPGKGW